MTYEVTSNKLSGFALGEFVTAEDLEGCNMEALQAAGHIRPVTAVETIETDTEED
jgi:hypothetical protein